MALFKIGSYGDIGVTLVPRKTIEKGRALPSNMPKVLPLTTATELASDIAVDVANYPSPSAWALCFREITLTKDFESFINGPTNELFFTALTWDYSGKPINVYPPAAVVKEESGLGIFKLVKGGTKKFGADGVCLWPPAPAFGALNFRILIFECDDDVRHVGETLVTIRDKVANSKLQQLVLAIAAAPQLTTIMAVGIAATELVGVIGEILKANRNDYIDLIEGSWLTVKPHKTENIHEEGYGCSLDLELTVT